MSGSADAADQTGYGGTGTGLPVEFPYALVTIELGPAAV